MNEASVAWVHKLDKSCMPALQANTELLRQLAASDKADIGQMTNLIESDPGLTLRLMRYINSLSHKHLRSEITTVRHALMMLGIDHVQKFSEDIPTIEALDENIQQRLLHHFNRSFHAAYQARDWGRLSRDAVIDELYLGALLHNIGAILLELNAPEEMDRVREIMRETQKDSEEAEYVVFGFSLDQLTLELAKHWRLPSILTDALQSENAQQNRVFNVMLAAQLAKQVEHGWYKPATTRLLEQIADFMLADVASVATMVHKNAVEAARLSSQFKVQHPAATLLYPATGEEEEQTEQTAETTYETEQSAESELCLLPQQKVLLRVMKALAQTTAEIPLKDIISLALEGMHEGLGLNRTVFAMLTPDKGQLKARSIRGSDNDAHFNRFVVDLANHNLFSRLMEKPQSLWLNDENRGKFFPLIPIQFHKLTHNEHFFVMSLFVRNKAVGMFYADRPRDCQLDAESYKQFKQIVAQVSHTLSRIAK
jgi:HD-like signal output (HDOD) protein